jgi:hypothetical protein
MASGPEHYALAESALAEIGRKSAEHHGTTTTVAAAMELHASIANGIAAAQVHAILALAAATASESSGSAYHVDSRWSEVLR